MLAMFLKMSRVVVCTILDQPWRLTPRMRSSDRCGTALLIAAFPAILIVSASYSLTFESMSAGTSEWTTLAKWSFFAFTASMLVFTYGLFIALGYSLKKGAREAGKVVEEIGQAVRKLSSSKGKAGGSGRESFFYQAGKEYAKGMVDGMEENIPGNQWKHPDKEPGDGIGGSDRSGRWESGNDLDDPSRN